MSRTPRTRRDYVSKYESNETRRKVEIRFTGRLFVANRAAAAVQLVDTICWASDRNVAVTDK